MLKRVTAMSSKQNIRRIHNHMQSGTFKSLFKFSNNKEEFCLLYLVFVTSKNLFRLFIARTRFFIHSLINANGWEFFACFGDDTNISGRTKIFKL